MLKAIIISLVVTQVFCATTMAPDMTTKHHNHHHHSHGTHGTRPTREPVEADKHYFKYDPTSHLMMAVNAKACYIYTMSSQESMDVHTVHGLHALEIKLITMIDDATATFQSITHDNLTTMSKSLAHSCKAVNMVMKLN
ncbi:uncharacterized protein LOC134686291 [Mytilus trossulus]|uniref:uncharacterized protein LOC134686291 n=1 Tax=Mytilus trossulus TaxID=6551 RepID=UPI0030069322